jgi:hypothetical protein
MQRRRTLAPRLIETPPGERPFRTVFQLPELLELKRSASAVQ